MGQVRENLCGRCWVRVASWLIDVLCLVAVQYPNSPLAWFLALLCQRLCLGSAAVVRPVNFNLPSAVEQRDGGGAAERKSRHAAIRHTSRGRAWGSGGDCFSGPRYSSHELN